MKDGLIVKGSFYPTTSGEKSPAVLLLHQNEGGRTEWLPLIPELTAKGYNVLAIDQRGFGLTRGKRNYGLLESDATTVLAWLREQSSTDPDRVAVIGSSVGANVALGVCAADDRCRVVIALSPGTNFFGIDSSSAVKAMNKKAVMLIAGQMDSASANAVRFLLPVVPQDTSVMARLYAGVANHGKDLLGYKDVIPMIVGWLDGYIN
jgi:pimeloyl-ACP methyl ester carboxylesterase